MHNPQLEIIIVAALAASACALPGVFLVLRRMAMMSDAISHSILAGIVIAFFITNDITSPWLVAAAAITGVLTVALVEILNNTKLLKEDSAIGIIFPLLFSVGVILISKYAGNAHIDVDAVLLGEIAFVPFNRFEVFGFDIGPKAMYELGGMTIINISFIWLFYKELKLITFDEEYASAAGFTPKVLHYGLMTLVSITAVGAFDAVGSILVVALMIAPPATAYLLTNRLSVMIIASVLIGVAASLGGYSTAHFFDVSIAGAMATMTGIIFVFVFLFAPIRGYIPRLASRKRQKWDFACLMLIVHVSNHESVGDAYIENRVEEIPLHFNWEQAFASHVIYLCEKRGLVQNSSGLLILTVNGKEEAKKAVVNS